MTAKDALEHRRSIGRCESSALLESATDDVGVTALAAASGLTVSTTHRLLKALAAAGLVAQDRDTERYHLGAGLIALGRRAEARLGLDRWHGALLQPRRRDRRVGEPRHTSRQRGADCRSCAVRAAVAVRRRHRCPGADPRLGNGQDVPGAVRRSGRRGRRPRRIAALHGSNPHRFRRPRRRTGADPPPRLVAQRR